MENMRVINQMESIYFSSTLDVTSEAAPMFYWLYCYIILYIEIAVSGL